ncbi:PAAR domain-containing protein [Actinoplanes regularis]|uniref:PAAR motif-containing protein n=1 Tax=Actinoplanes regularis TaxID=52697 RepID=A0A239FLQ6_9ACTN|nr:PAAR domain-containing protein [Actinoplanes regularis]GIE89672.1 PAAR motif protein [Actinoplanes regularis]SNS57866.1 PAAR motif-containing protein [Actinoplanes regularis]
MGAPAARQNDPVTGTDVHILLVPSPGGPVPTPTPMPFTGRLLAGLSADVLVDGLPVATIGSVAHNLPPHVPAAGPFSRPPTNQGRVLAGSTTVLVNGKGVARLGDPVLTCNDPADLPNGTIAAGSADVLVG